MDRQTDGRLDRQTNEHHQRHQHQPGVEQTLINCTDTPKVNSQQHLPRIRGWVTHTHSQCHCLIESEPPVYPFFSCRSPFRAVVFSRFSLFGGFFMGPTVYAWMRLASVMWPRRDIRSSLCKAVTEQTAYDPMAISTFLFTMSLMEGKTFEEAKNEVSI